MHLSVTNASDSTGSLARHNRVSRLECTSGGLVESRKIRALAGHAVPTDDERLKATVRGIRRALGTATREKAPATAERVISMALGTGNGLKALRDRALLLGFAGAFRRSELVALNDRARPLPSSCGSISCPVAAVQAWRSAAGIATGPLFRCTVAFTRSSSVGTAWPASARILRDSTRPPLVHSKRETYCAAQESLSNRRHSALINASRACDGVICPREDSFPKSIFPLRNFVGYERSDTPSRCAGAALADRVPLDHRGGKQICSAYRHRATSRLYPSLPCLLPTRHGRYWGYNGPDLLSVRFSESDPYRPSVAHFCCDAQHTPCLTIC